MVRAIARWATPAVVGLLFGSSVLAQTTGQLRGLVTDTQGTPLPGVTVVVECPSVGIAGRGAVTTAAGTFQVPGLPPTKDCTVKATLSGFAGLSLSDVGISSGQTTTVTLALPPEGAVRERVEVRAQPDVIDLSKPTSGAQISSEFISALPLLGRNYQDALTLAPGVTDVDGDGNPNIHGARDTDLMTQMDGVNTTDPLTGKNGARINIESIQEIEFITAGAGAEFGRSQGGYANIITKSGGNAFEGAFKFFWRGWRLDGDGAGIDDPRLHAGVGESGLRDLRFNDYLPFFSLGGPIKKDRAWFFLTSEYIQTQEPVNALNTAFVRELREFRQFVKLTWQVTENHRLGLSLNYDPQEYLNEGLNSFTQLESGYTTKAGGTVVTLRDTAILSPTVTLETTLSDFDGRPAVVPTLGRDTNGNGIVSFDRNGNGFMEASERDPGEDYDRDGVFDVFEDQNHNGVLDPGEDIDGDHRLTPDLGCEGYTREDTDCDGHLDSANEDTNHNGFLDLYSINPFVGEDQDGDGRLDLGTENRNGNISRYLDDTPRPTSLYPYGHLVPEEPDRDYTIGQSIGIVSGPYFMEQADQRRRLTLRQDLGVYIPDARGSHDVKGGWIAEQEDFSRTTKAAPIESADLGCTVGALLCKAKESSMVKVLLPAETSVENEASGLSTGLYVQDNFKPTPNLNIGLGVRFDRERTGSFGYSPFDPALERAPYDRLTALSGGEIHKNDPNNDGLQSFGVVGDPIFGSNADLATATITDPLRVAAIGRLTRHHSAALFESSRLAALFPEIFMGGELNVKRLRELGVSTQQPETFEITNNNLAPRLSLSWDPTKDGRTKLFTTWGRYYDRLFLSTIVGEEGPDYLARYYNLDSTGLSVLYRLGWTNGNWRPIPMAATPDHNIGAIRSRAAPSITQVDRELRTPFSDELTLGFQREIAPEVALSVTYVDRRYRDQLQDIDINHTLHLDPVTGEPVDRLGQLLSTSTNDSQRVPDSRPDLYIQNPFFNQILRIGNFNEMRYRGIELQVIRRMVGRWQMQGSYTYSRAVGSAEDFQSRLGNDPSTLESEFGYLDYDQRHVVKLYTQVHLPHDWQTGSALTWATGLPYSVISRFFALDDEDYQQFRTRFGYTVIDPSQGVHFQSMRRNSERNDATMNIDVNVRKTFVIGKTMAAASLEIFNLLNSDDLRIFTVEPNKSQTNPGVGGSSGTSIDPLFALPLQVNGERRFGRRFQVGLHLQF